MSDNWKICVRPPFTDDTWGIVKVHNIDSEYWQAESRQDALDGIHQRLDAPRETIVNQETPVTPETVVIDAHPDYDGVIALEQLLGNQTGLGTFGAGSDPFANTHWHEQQPEYKLVEELRTRPDEVLQVTAGSGSDTEEHSDEPAWSGPEEASGTETHPDEWPWNRSLWACVGDDGFDIIAFHAEEYDWQRFSDRDATFLVRFLQQEWLTAKSDTMFTQFLLDEERSKDEINGAYLWTPEKTQFVSPTETPFADDFDHCPNTQSRVNGWVYLPSGSWAFHCEQWVDDPDEPNKRIVLKHHHSDFSFLNVVDDRPGGGHFRPDCFPSKSQAEYSPAELRSEAVEWMARNPPDQVEHPHYTPEFAETFPGWTRIKDPRVGTRNNTIAAAHAQPAPHGTVRVLYIWGTPGATDFQIQLQYRYQRQYDCTLIHCDETPIELPSSVSAAVAQSRARRLADKFESRALDDPDAEAAIRDYFDRLYEPLPAESGDPDELDTTKIGAR